MPMPLMGMRGMVVATVALAMLAGPAAAADRKNHGLIQDPEYPQIRYSRDAGEVWYTRRTGKGCLYYKSASPDIHREQVLVSAEWAGAPCTPGRYITGKGKLTESVEVPADRDEWTTYQTGTMEDGVFQGPVIFGSSVMGNRTSTIQMFGGCQPEGEDCRPRHRKPHRRAR